MADLSAVTSRFPEQELEIYRMAANDPDFSELCEVYVAAAMALDRWKDDSITHTEYRQILSELEQDIEHCLGRARR